MMTKLVLSRNCTDYRYIYHISDIHIRVLERHEEYRTVFDTLFAQLADQPKGVIVITGDVFHCRGKLLSETILLFDYLVEGLTALMDTIMIPGNHDAYTKSHRLDVIYGVVNVKQYTNFWYIYRPGTYTLGNIDFVYLTDTCLAEEEPSTTTSQEENYRVALYHGMIQGSVLDNDLTNREQGAVSLPYLESSGYTLGLLGDIHKHQFLRGHIAYAGSLIQQNHKEPYGQGHGYIQWDLQSRSGTFHDVYNATGFLTYTIEGNNPGEWSNISKKTKKDVVFPKSCRLRIRVIGPPCIPLTEIESNAVEILKAKGVEVLSVNKELRPAATSLSSLKRDGKGSNTTTTTTSTTTENDGGVGMPTVESLFIKVWKDKNPDVECSAAEVTTMEEIMKVHTDLTKDLHQQQASSDGSGGEAARPWSLESLEFQNLFLYGGNHRNRVDFKGRKGTVGILGDNAIGKTAILNIILFALFGTVSKTKGATKNIINKHHKSAYVKLRLRIRGDDSPEIYSIVRECKVRKRGAGISLEETLHWSWQNERTGDSRGLNEENKTATNEKLRQVLGLGDLSSFAMTNIISNDVVHTNSFVSMTSSELDTVFRMVFDLEMYKSAFQEAGKHIRQLQKTLSELEGEKKGRLAALRLLGKQQQHHHQPEEQHQDEEEEASPNNNSSEKMKTSLETAVAVCEENLIRLRLHQKELVSQVQDISRKLDTRTSLELDELSDDWGKAKSSSRGDVKSIKAELYAAKKKIAVPFVCHPIIEEKYKEVLAIHPKDASHETFYKAERFINLIDMEIRRMKKQYPSMMAEDDDDDDDGDDTANKRLPETEEELWDHYASFDLRPVLVLPKGTMTQQEAEEILQEQSPKTFWEEVALMQSYVREIKAAIVRGIVSIAGKRWQQLETFLDGINTDLVKKLNRDIEAKRALDLWAQVHEITEVNKKITKEKKRILSWIMAVKEKNRLLLTTWTARFVLDENVRDLEKELVEAQERVKWTAQMEELQKKSKVIGDQIQEEETIRTSAIKSLGKLNATKASHSAAIAAARAEMNLEIERKEAEAAEALAAIDYDIECTQHQLHTFQTYRSLVDDTGVPHLILRESVAHVEEVVNRILGQTVGFTMTFSSTPGSGSAGSGTTAKSGKWQVVILKDGIELTPEQCSGYERFILNVAIKIGLDKHKANGGIRTLFIDECWDCVTQDNLERIDDLLHELVEYYDHVLVISHNEELKTKVDSLIEIQPGSGKGGSRIR